jgi:aspartate ammonia-lyase
MQTQTEKSNLEKFYQGWPHFQSMNMGENFIVFKVELKYVESSIAKAKQRIKELNLPLIVVGTSSWSNTFIVKEHLYIAGEQCIYNVREVAA